MLGTILTVRLPDACMSHSNSHICLHPPLLLQVDLPEQKAENKLPGLGGEAPDHPAPRVGRCFRLLGPRCVSAASILIQPRSALLPGTASLCF